MTNFMAKHVKLPRIPELCNSISEISTKEDIITIHYNGKVPTNNVSIISSHFSLVCKWNDQQIFFPLGSGEIVNLSKDSFSLRFFLPVVSQYAQSKLYCSAPPYNISKLREEMMKFVLSEFTVDLEVPQLGFGAGLANDPFPYQYSRFKCHNEDVFQSRWCEFRNIVYFDDYFFFLSPAMFSFPEPFLVPGPRAPPFDIVTDRFTIEPVVISFNTKTVPRKLELINDYSFIYGVFHNFYMLWHALFDFAVPLYNFMFNILPKNYSIITKRESRRVFVKSDGVWIFDSLMKLFSYHPVTILRGLRKNYLFEKGTIGIEKLELNVASKKYEDNMVNFKYNFNRQTGKGLRERTLEQLGINATDYGYVDEDGDLANQTKVKKPLVTFIDRGSGVRNIQNTPDVFKVMEQGCGDFCKALSVKFHKKSVEEQVKIVSRSSVLVGLHGSGLAHVIYMHAYTKNDPSFLIEFLPYKYSCRDWYHVAANVAGVKYISVMNKKLPTEPLRAGGDNKKEPCYNDPGLCGTLHCHDILRDQKTWIELDTFNQTWMKVVNQLKEAYGNRSIG